MKRPFHIRPAEERDGPGFVALVRALAEFEKLAGPDDAAAARLQADAFGPARRFELLVAERETASEEGAPSGELVGYALYFMTYSTFLARPSLYLEDLFVLPSWRGRGVGAAFMRSLGREAVARGCGRFEWTVLDWNVRAQAFYESLGARVLGEWRVCRVDGEALDRLGREG
jgi:GNAT superfamily N-acetyltransferase